MMMVEVEEIVIDVSLRVNDGGDMAFFISK
jgi:hypothetical protein